MKRHEHLVTISCIVTSRPSKGESMSSFPKIGQPVLNFIDGVWEESASGKWTDRYDPANQAVLVTRAPDSNRDDAIRAIDSAARAAAVWRGWPAPKRGRLLFDWLAW